MSPEIGEKHHTTHEDGGNDEINISGLTGAVQIVDTPADGETTKGISSNWAYDENVTLRALIEATLPWLISIDVFPTAKSNVNWNTIVQDGSYLHAGIKQSSAAQNDEITWDVVLGAGTWSVELFYHAVPNAGIFSIQFDSVEKGTIDGYNSVSTPNTRSSVTGIVVPLTKKIEFKLKMATKNPSSSNYVAGLNDVRLIRTA